MLKLFSTVAAIGLALQIGSVSALAAGTSCNGAMAQLMDRWQAIGYQMPQKPAQGRIIGNNGHVASGQQVAYMRRQIGEAAQECAMGDNEAALNRIASVSSLLDKQSIRTADRTQ
jgi:hypothetical protein